MRFSRAEAQSRMRRTVRFTPHAPPLFQHLERRRHPAPTADGAVLRAGPAFAERAQPPYTPWIRISRSPPRAREFTHLRWKPKGGVNLFVLYIVKRKCQPRKGSASEPSPNGPTSVRSWYGASLTKQGPLPDAESAVARGSAGWHGGAAFDHAHHLHCDDHHVAGAVTASARCLAKRCRIRVGCGRNPAQRAAYQRRVATRGARPPHRTIRTAPLQWHAHLP